MAALPVATGGVGTIQGSTPLRSYGTALAAADHEIVAPTAGRKIQLIGVTMTATNADNTIQFFTDDPGGTGAPVSEIMCPAVQTNTILGPSMFVVAETLAGQGLWAQIAGTGTVNAHFTHILKA